jgi:lycopene cyclase domain-containing protein
VDHLLYTSLLVGCLVVTLPLELVIGARVYRRPGTLAAAVLPVAAAFVVWDALATTSAGWWSFDAHWVLDLPRPLGLPPEEWAFFLVVPTCAVLTLEAVRRLRPEWFRTGGQDG